MEMDKDLVSFPLLGPFLKSHPSFRASWERPETSAEYIAQFYLQDILLLFLSCVNPETVLLINLLLADLCS
jgi:hypothetical protein